MFALVLMSLAYYVKVSDVKNPDISEVSETVMSWRSELCYPQMRLGIYFGFGLVAPPPRQPQTPCERDNSKTKAQNFMKLCRSLGISM